MTRARLCPPTGSREGGQRRIKAREQQRQRDDGARLQLTAESVEAPDPVDESKRQGRHQRQSGDEYPLHHRGAHTDVAHPPGAGCKFRRLLHRTAEELHERRSGGRETLGHLRAHDRVVVCRFTLEPRESIAHPARGQHEYGQQE
jgi:hypothetical protein